MPGMVRSRINPLSTGKQISKNKITKKVIKHVLVFLKNCLALLLCFLVANGVGPILKHLRHFDVCSSNV